MREKVRVLRTEAREDDVVTVSATIGVGVVIEAHVGAVLDEGAVFVGQEPERHHETIGEYAGRRGDGRLAGRGRSVGRIKDDDFIAAAGGEERIGSEFLFVAVDGIFEGGHRPEPHARIPSDGDKFPEAGGLGGNEFNFKTGGYDEGAPFFLGRTRATGNGVVTDVAGRGSGRRRRRGGGRGWRGRGVGFRSGRFRRGGRFGRGRLGVADLVPRRRAGRGREFVDHDVLELRERRAAAVNLKADVPVERDGRIGLSVIERGDAVEPRTQARAFNADAVLVPIAGAHGRGDGGKLGGCGDDLVAPRFVVEFAPPAVAGVDLIAGHLGGLRHAQAAELHAAVDETDLGVAGEFDFQAKLEILKRARGREKLVLRNLCGGRPAGDGAVLDAPPF